MSGLGKDRHISKELKNPDYCTDLEDYRGQLDVVHRHTIVAFCVKDVLCKRTTDEGYEVDREIAEVSRVIALNLYHAGALRHAQVGLLMINYFRDVFVFNFTENKLAMRRILITKYGPLCYPLLFTK